MATPRKSKLTPQQIWDELVAADATVERLLRLFKADRETWVMLRDHDIRRALQYERHLDPHEIPSEAGVEWLRDQLASLRYDGATGEGT